MSPVVPIVVCLNLLVVKNHVYESYDESFQVCLAVAREAQRQDVDVELVVALAYHESRMNPLSLSDPIAHNDGEGGCCIGPLQVSQQYQCIIRNPETGRSVRDEDGNTIPIPLEECDLIRVGVFAIWRHLRTYDGDEVSAVAHYNGGNHPPERSFQWAREVVQTADMLRRRRGTLE